MRYDRKKAEARFGHLFAVVSGDECHYCGLPSDGYDHRPAIYTLHKFAKDRQVTRRQIEERFGTCRLLPCCTVCNMGIGSFEGDHDNDYRDEILSFLDFFDDEGDRKGDWSYGAFAIACEILDARAKGLLGDEIYALPVVGRLIMSFALRVKKGEWADNPFFHEHRERFAAWLKAVPRRKAKHFLDMARLESYKFKKGVYDRT